MSKAYELGKQAYIVEDRIQRIDEMLEKMQSDFVDPETGELSEEAYMEMMDAATSRLSSEYELENLINEIGKEICNLEYLCKESDDIISVQKYRKKLAQKDMGDLEQILRRLTGESRTQTHDCDIRFRSNTVAEIEDETEFINYCLQNPEVMAQYYRSKTTYEPNKVNLKKALGSGADIPYVHSKTYKSISVNSNKDNK